MPEVPHSELCLLSQVKLHSRLWLHADAWCLTLDIAAWDWLMWYQLAVVMYCVGHFECDSLLHCGPLMLEVSLSCIQMSWCRGYSKSWLAVFSLYFDPIAGASNPSFSTLCLTTLMPPNVDIDLVLVDFSPNMDADAKTMQETTGTRVSPKTCLGIPCWRCSSLLKMCWLSRKRLKVMETWEVFEVKHQFHPIVSFLRLVQTSFIK